MRSIAQQSNDKRDKADSQSLIFIQSGKRIIQRLTQASSIAAKHKQRAIPKIIQ